MVSVNGEVLKDLAKVQVPSGDNEDENKPGMDMEDEEYWLKMNQNNPATKEEPKTVEESFGKAAEKYGLKPATPLFNQEEETSSANDNPSGFTDRVARFVGKFF